MLDIANLRIRKRALYFMLASRAYVHCGHVRITVGFKAPGITDSDTSIEDILALQLAPGFGLFSPSSTGMEIHRGIPEVCVGPAGIHAR